MNNMLDLFFATPDEVCREIGARIKTRRLAHGWTQTDLAARANVAKGTVQNLENRGTGSLESLVKLALALELTDDLQELFRFKFRSIAEMTAAEPVTRKRARRKRSAA